MRAASLFTKVFKKESLLKLLQIWQVHISSMTKALSSHWIPSSSKVRIVKTITGECLIWMQLFYHTEMNTNQGKITCASYMTQIINISTVTVELPAVSVLWAGAKWKNIPIFHYLSDFSHFIPFFYPNLFWFPNLMSFFCQRGNSAPPPPLFLFAGKATSSEFKQWSHFRYIRSAAAHTDTGLKQKTGKEPCYWVVDRKNLIQPIELQRWIDTVSDFFTLFQAKW